MLRYLIKFFEYFLFPCVHWHYTNCLLGLFVFFSEKSVIFFTLNFDISLLLKFNSFSLSKGLQTALSNSKRVTFTKEWTTCSFESVVKITSWSSFLKLGHFNRKYVKQKLFVIFVLICSYLKFAVSYVITMRMAVPLLRQRLFVS